MKQYTCTYDGVPTVVTVADGRRYRVPYDDGRRTRDEAYIEGRRLALEDARPAPKPSATPAPAAPPSPPLTRAETIRQLCALYGADKHADYLIASGADPAQAAAILSLLRK